MSSVKIIVDIREKQPVQDQFKKNEILSTITEFQQLDVGDIWIYHQDKLFMIIERKTIEDLSASIKDGRYKSQKMRMIKYALDSNLDRSNIMYLIEEYHINRKRKKIGSMPISTIESAMFNLQVRDGFRVYHTDDIQHTVNSIVKIHNCLLKYGCYHTPEIKNPMDEIIRSNVKTVKKENITPELAFIAQLSVIPGVSPTLAKLIITKYPTMLTLIKAFESLESDDKRKKMLTDIDRIGKKLSERIYQYIYK